MIPLGFRIKRASGGKILILAVVFPLNADISGSKKLKILILAGVFPFNAETSDPKNHLVPTWSPLGSHLVPMWSHLARLGSLVARLGPIWPPLGPTWSANLWFSYIFSRESVPVDAPPVAPLKGAGGYFFDSRWGFSIQRRDLRLKET